MELLDDHPPLDLYDRDWVIHTRSEERAPARIGPTASVHRSLISHGCLIAGTVERSVLSPGVRVDPGAIVRDSVIMFDCDIRAGAVVDRAILDKEVSVGPERRRGHGRRLRHAQPPGADPAQHGHHARGQARGHPRRGAHRAQRAIGEDVRPADFGSRKPCAAAAQSKHAPRPAPRPAGGRGRPKANRSPSGWRSRLCVGRAAPIRRLRRADTYAHAKRLAGGLKATLPHAGAGALLDRCTGLSRGSSAAYAAYSLLAGRTSTTTSPDDSRRLASGSA